MNNKSKIIKYLKELKIKKGSIPKIEDINDILLKEIMTEFGSFEHGLLAAGMNAIKPGKMSGVSDEYYLQHLKETVNDIGRIPSRQEEKHFVEIVRRFGSIEQALEQIGMNLEKLNQITDEYYLENLRKIAEKLGKSPGRRDINNYSTIKKRFGGMGPALKMAGININRYVDLTKEDCERILKKEFEKAEDVITMADWNKRDDLPASDTILKKIGYSSWTQLTYDYFGVFKHSIGDIGDKDEFLVKLSDELNKIGSTKLKEYEAKRSKGMPIGKTIIEAYGKEGWGDILMLINRRANTKTWSKTEIIEMILKLYDETKEVPSINSFTKKYGFIDRSVKSLFGSWNNALIESGLGINQESAKVNESDEELLKMYKDFSEKIGKPASARDLDDSEEIYNSDVFMIRFGGMVGLKKAAGYEITQRGRKKYSKEMIKDILIEAYQEKGARPTNSEITKILSTTTILRYFKTTKMKDVWDEIEEAMQK